MNTAIETQFRDPATIYEPLDEEINAQVLEMGDFNSDVDFDETVFWYLRIMNTYSYITLFGILFPMSFLTSWIISVIDMRTIRTKLIHESKRPTPAGIKTIGLWLEMISFVANMAVFTNSFIISLVVLDTKTAEVQFVMFVVLTILLFILRGKIKVFFRTRLKSVRVKNKRSE